MKLSPMVDVFAILVLLLAYQARKDSSADEEPKKDAKTIILDIELDESRVATSNAAAQSVKVRMAADGTLWCGGKKQTTSDFVENRRAGENVLLCVEPGVPFEEVAELMTVLKQKHVACDIEVKTRTKEYNE